VRVKRKRSGKARVVKGRRRLVNKRGDEIGSNK
jgi:hypothetical protein